MKFECSVGSTKYTIEDKSPPDQYVQLTRTNGKDVQVTFYPIKLIVRYALHTLFSKLANFLENLV